MSKLTVLDSNVLARVALIMLLKRLGIEAHIARHETAAADATGLRVHDGMAPLGGLHELGVLLLEDGEVALGFPVPDGVGGEDEVHFLEGALVRFGVEGPDDDERGGVDGAEDVERFFVQGREHGREQEHLCGVSGDLRDGGGLLWAWDKGTYSPAVTD